MQTTIRVWATAFHYKIIVEFSSFNHISFFAIFLFIYLGCGAPGQRVDEFKRMCAVLLSEVQFGDGSVGCFAGILDLFASIVCEQILRVAANYQISHDR